MPKIIIIKSNDIIPYLNTNPKIEIRELYSSNKIIFSIIIFFFLLILSYRIANEINCMLRIGNTTRPRQKIYIYRYVSES